MNGGTLHLISKENMLNATTFKNYMINNGVNTLFITTALFNQFISEDKTIFNCLKHLMFGGEATSERHVEMLREQKTSVDFRNVYGPTETTTFAAHYIIKDKVDKTPIGKPISNTSILDKLLSLIFNNDQMVFIFTIISPNSSLIVIHLG